MKMAPIFEGKVAMGPPPELLWLVEPEERPLTTMLMAEVTVLETRHIAEPEHDVNVAELEHETALADVPEVSRLEPWDMFELECETTVVEVPEVTRLERPRLPKGATMVELESLVSQVQLRGSVPREMPKTEAAVACLGWLRRHCQCRHYSCEHHHFAHRVAPLIGRAAQPAACLSGARRKSELRGPSFGII
jgi:hypothetical protein